MHGRVTDLNFDHGRAFLPRRTDGGAKHAVGCGKGHRANRLVCLFDRAAGRIKLERGKAEARRRTTDHRPANNDRCDQLLSGIVRTAKLVDRVPQVSLAGFTGFTHVVDHVSSRSASLLQALHW